MVCAGRTAGESSLINQKKISSLVEEIYAPPPEANRRKPVYDVASIHGVCNH